MLLVASNREPNSSCLNLEQEKSSVERTLEWVWFRKRRFPHLFTLLSTVLSLTVRLTLLQDPQMPLMTPVNGLVSWADLDGNRKPFPEAVLDTQGSVFPWDLCSPVLEYLAQIGFCAHLWSWPGNEATLIHRRGRLLEPVSLGRGNVAKWLKIKKGAVRMHHVVY